MRVTLVAAACLAATAGVETGAWLLRAWAYRARWHRVVSAVADAAALAGISVALGGRAPALRFAAGAAFGVALEAANLYALRIWTFPGDRLFFVRGRAAIVLAAGLPFGFIPVFAPLAAAW
jgi:hypothetical protein